MNKNQKNKYIVLFKGPLNTNEVVVLHDKNFKLNLTTEEKLIVDQIWKDEIKKAGKNKVKLFDSCLLNLVSSTYDQKLKIKTRPTSYKYYVVGLKSKNNLLKKKLIENFPFSISALIQTSDEKLVLAKRSDKTYMDKGTIHLIPAGHPEINKPKIDLFEEILKEAEEECGIIVKDITDFHLLGIVKTLYPFKPEVIFHLRLGLSLKEFERKISFAKDSWEHKKLLFIDSDDLSIKNFVKKNNVLPAAQGALDLFISTRK